MCLNLCNSLYLCKKSFKLQLITTMAALWLAGCASSPETPVPVVAPKPAVVVTEEMQQLYGNALQAFNLERLGQAEVYLQQLIDIEPNLSAPYVTRGRIAEMKGDKESAKLLYRHALEVDAGNHMAMHQLAMLAREEGEFERARELYESAIALKPEEPLYHRNYAILLDLYLGDLENALKHYELYQKIRKQPDNQVALWVVDLKRRIQ
ncbi:hypothetical protein BTA51_10880 [Hahella sp. CCB-MM4]|uniref:tetratricopeptide repeat protein n=1 Tax=Hahella sp. (strain CCB-MM4) TaxID=1926491 RepID=UPI000B9AAF30|nr:tetratricopeptide repeat protein [Hahella sp. CCB-MM4]OZG73512.1 hypothetical protein BTA51_10880 [Hahella sp. CCB-MM4]